MSCNVNRFSACNSDRYGTYDLDGTQLNTATEGVVFRPVVEKPHLVRAGRDSIINPVGEELIGDALVGGSLVSGSNESSSLLGTDRLQGGPIVGGSYPGSTCKLQKGGCCGANYGVYGYDGVGDQVGGGVDQVGGFFGISNTFIARLLMSALFIYTGIMAVANFSQYSQSIASSGIPYPTVVAIISIIFQLLGGLLFTGILAVYNSVSWGRLALLFYLAGSTFMSHNAFKNPSEITNMLQNLAIIGGLMLA